MRRIAIYLVAWLAIVWTTLWENWTLANLVAGLLLAVGLVWLLPPDIAPRSGRMRPLAALHFLIYFLYQLMASTAVVAWEVVTPRSRINEGIVAVPIKGVSRALTALVANAISLTPGTLTIETSQEGDVLYVHVLHLHDIEEVRAGVLKLEDLAIAAFGQPRQRSRS